MNEPNGTAPAPAPDLVANLESALGVGTPTEAPGTPSPQETAAPGVEASQAPIPDSPPGAAPSAETKERQRDPVTGQFLPEQKPEPKVPFGEWGEIPVSELPKFHQELVEFERAQLKPQIDTLTQERAALQQQLQAAQQKAAEAQAYLDNTIRWAQQDPNGFYAFLTSQGMGPQGQPQPGFQPQAPFAPPQAPQPQYMTREQFEQTYKEMRAQEQEQARVANEALAFRNEITGELKNVLDRELPETRYGAAHKDVLRAVERRMAEAPPGTFVKGMTKGMILRRFAHIVNGVKEAFSGFSAQQAQAQANVTQQFKAQPNGGATMIPKTAPKPYEPFNVDRFAAEMGNRFKEHLTGL